MKLEEMMPEEQIQSLKEQLHGTGDKTIIGYHLVELYGLEELTAAIREHYPTATVKVLLDEFVHTEVTQKLKFGDKTTWVVWPMLPTTIVQI